MQTQSRAFSALLALALIAAACEAAAPEEETPTAPPPTATEPPPPPPTETLEPTAEPAPPSNDDLRFLDLGPFDSSADITFTLEPGDVTFIFTAQTDKPEENIAITQITGPDGLNLYTLDDYETGAFTSDMFNTALDGLGGEVTVVMPTAPQFDLAPGDYKMRVETNGAPITSASVVIRSGDADGEQAIDLNIWVLSEAEAVNAPDQREALAESIRASVDKILNQQSMRLGQINFIEGTAEQKMTYARIDTEAELCKAMADVVGVGRAWSMALVDELISKPEDASGEPEPIFGQSTTPGTVFAPASTNSCFQVAWEIHNNDYNEFGATIVHEGSHFLGLQHTTEQDGKIFDVLNDTPQCPVEQFDADGSNDVDDAECGLDGGADNFIFWNSSGVFKDFVLSGDQGWVMRRHPLFYAVNP